MKQNELVFEKRMNIYRKYRSEINKESMKSLDPYLYDQRLIRQKKLINNIDPSILKPINSNISLSQGKQLDIDFAKDYTLLNFDINGLDNNLINSIKEEMKNAETIKDSNFIINKDGELISNEDSESKAKIEYLNTINEKLNEVANQIQLFPKTSKDDLKILDKSLAIAKTKKEPIAKELRVDSSPIKETHDFKKFFFISLYLSIFFLVLVIIMVVLLLVL